jgi:hypothetical protein
MNEVHKLEDLKCQQEAILGILKGLDKKIESTSSCLRAKQVVAHAQKYLKIESVFFFNLACQTEVNWRNSL